MHCHCMQSLPCIHGKRRQWDACKHWLHMVLNLIQLDASSSCNQPDVAVLPGQHPDTQAQQ
jgi:hypothetical protein